MTIRARSTRTAGLVAVVALGLALAGCSSSSSDDPTVSTTAATSSPAAASTSSTPLTLLPTHRRSEVPSAPVASTTKAAATSTAAAVNYAQQFTTDTAPWDAAIKKATGGITSPSAAAAGTQAVAVARRLLSQTWPAADLSDVHALALQFDLINEDIQAHDLAKYRTDGTTLNADANVVRAELGLAQIR